MSNSDWQKWSKENNVGWVPAEPPNLTFNESPWEGQLTYNNVGKMIQYRKGTWQLI